jgi:hypothetical protein
MGKAMSYFGAAGVWPLSPDKFIEIDCRPPQQTSDVSLQVRKNEKLPAEEIVTLVTETLIER